MAIGRRSGKIKAGTIVMFAVDQKGIIIDARKMQGVTVLAKFRLLPQYIGTDIHYIDNYHPLVRTENKLVQQAMVNAREIYLRVELGNYQEESLRFPTYDAWHSIQFMEKTIPIKKKEC